MGQDVSAREVVARTRPLPVRVGEDGVWGIRPTKNLLAPVVLQAPVPAATALDLMDLSDEDLLVRQRALEAEIAQRGRAAPRDELSELPLRAPRDELEKLELPEVLQLFHNSFENI